MSKSEMDEARDWAEAALRPSTLAAEFRVTKEEIIAAIAAALLPFVKARRERETQR